MERVSSFFIGNVIGIAILVAGVMLTAPKKLKETAAIEKQAAQAYTDKPTVQSVATPSLEQFATPRSSKDSAIQKKLETTERPAGPVTSETPARSKTPARSETTTRPVTSETPASSQTPARQTSSEKIDRSTNSRN